jgi:glycosyltransferase involved in cell wall biosynthesis
MGSAHRTLVIVPAWNEEVTISDVIAEIRTTNPAVDILVVNDGSQDATSRVARSAGALVADLPFNLGVGGAMRTGYRFAYDNDYDHVVQIDADGQHDPSRVPELIALLDDHDIAIGARFAGTGDYVASGPRRWAMVLLASVLSRVAHTRLTDTTSGFRAAGRRAIRVFAFDYPAEYLGDTIEALVIAARSGCTITQLPVAMRARAGGRPSHNPAKAAAYLGRAMMALVFALVRPRRSLPS